MLNKEQIDALVEGSIVHLSTTKEEWQLSPIPTEQKKNFDNCDFVGKYISNGVLKGLILGHNVLFNKEDLIPYNLGRYQKTAQNSPWISCKERMPNEGEQVFVKALHRGYLVAYVEKWDDKICFVEKGEHGLLDVESWMPIPE